MLYILFSLLFISQSSRMEKTKGENNERGRYWYWKYCCHHRQLPTQEKKLIATLQPVRRKDSKERVFGKDIGNYFLYMDNSLLALNFKYERQSHIVWNSVGQLHLSCTPVSKLGVKNSSYFTGSFSLWCYHIPCLKFLIFVRKTLQKRHYYFLPRWYLYYTDKMTVFLIEILQVIAGIQVPRGSPSCKDFWICLSWEHNLKLYLFFLLQV